MTPRHDLYSGTLAPLLPNTSFTRFVRRLIHATVYHLMVKAAITRTDNVTMFGFSLTVPPSVFHPRFYLTSHFFAEYLLTLDLRNKELLEVGCGSGLLSLVAARVGARVTALDINPRAAETTLLNAESNGLQGRVRVLKSDLFGELSATDTFDRILWSPPFFPREPSDDASYAWNAGREYSSIGRFARSVGAHLRPQGEVLLLLSSEINVPALLSIFESSGFTPRLARFKRKLFETLFIYVFQR